MVVRAEEERKGNNNTDCDDVIVRHTCGSIHFEKFRRLLHRVPNEIFTLAFDIRTILRKKYYEKFEEKLLHSSKKFTFEAIRS